MAVEAPAATGAFTAGGQIRGNMAASYGPQFWAKSTDQVLWDGLLRAIHDLTPANSLTVSPAARARAPLTAVTCATELHRRARSLRLLAPADEVREAFLGQLTDRQRHEVAKTLIDCGAWE